MEKYIFYICIAAYYLYRYIDRVMEPETANPANEQMAEKKNILYMVNEKEISLPLHVYYQQVLDLYGRDEITDDLIMVESSRLLEKAADNQNEILISDRNEIKAARSFLLDQWNYVVWLN